MANLTASRPDARQEGILVDVDLAAVKVFAGSNLNYNVAGYATKASATANENFAGVAMETVDNTTGAAGDKYVRAWKEGVFSMNCTGATRAWVGQDVYAVDDNLVKLFDAGAGAVNIRVGKVVGFVSATEVRVKI